jgi:class 3 adenylate cyclase
VLAELLNEYVGGLTDVAFAHEGTVAKVIGDTIQVMFCAWRSERLRYACDRLRAGDRSMGGGISRALEAERR